MNQQNNDSLLPPAGRWFTKRLAQHLLFWVVYLGFCVVFIFFGVYQIREAFFYETLPILFSLDVLMAYFNLYVLIPRFLAKGRYGLYGMLLVATLVFTAWLNTLLKILFAKTGSPIYNLMAPYAFANIIGTLAERFYPLAITTAIKISKDWLQNRRRLQESEKQTLEAELNFLKSQIQPHFFFNTLNNLYSLTLKKSDEAPGVVLKLSDLMSYMLYETNTAKVPLNKEINYLQNYIDLERLRFGKNIALQFIMDGETNGIQVPPLVLVLFVENGFKHGLRNADNTLELDILLRAEKDSLYFMVKNKTAVNPTHKTAAGIGLKNVRRRLDLLYGNNYTLQETKEGDTYTVALKLPV